MQPSNNNNNNNNNAQAPYDYNVHTAYTVKSAVDMYNE
jgi:hypothetical protein